MHNRLFQKVAILLTVMAFMTYFSGSAFADTIHYDKLNRMYEILYDDGSSIHYTYDANGNITNIEKRSSSDQHSGETDQPGEEDPKENPDQPGEEDPKENPDQPGKTDPNENPEEKTDSGKDTGKTNPDHPASSETGRKDTNAALPGNQIETGNAVYQITSVQRAYTVKLVRLKKKVKAFKVPDTVTYENRKYQVTEIAELALKGQGKLKKLTIGKNVAVIGKKACFGCKKLKKITIRSAKLKKIGKRAFTGTDRNLVIKVPKKQKQSYKKLFKNKGMKKTARIK